MSTSLSSISFSYFHYSPNFIILPFPSYGFLSNSNIPFKPNVKYPLIYSTTPCFFNSLLSMFHSLHSSYSFIPVSCYYLLFLSCNYSSNYYFPTSSTPSPFLFLPSHSLIATTTLHIFSSFAHSPYILTNNLYSVLHFAHSISLFSIISNHLILSTHQSLSHIILSNHLFLYPSHILIYSTHLFLPIFH